MATHRVAYLGAYVNSKLIQILSTIFLITFSSLVTAEIVFPISKVCNNEILSQIENPTTKDPEQFVYFLNIIQGSCYQKATISRSQQANLTHYFADIGSPVAKYLIDKNLKNLLAEARTGNISAQILFVHKNTHYSSTAIGNTAQRTIRIPEKEYKQYVETMIRLALKGDARAIVPTINHMVDAQTSNYSSKERFDIAQKLTQDFGQYNMIFSVLLNTWKINSFDLKICAGTKKTLERQNMEALCGLFFDHTLYNKLASMSPEERLTSFRDYLSVLELPEPDVDSLDAVNSWRQKTKSIAVYSLFDVPYSTELIPFMLQRPSSSVRALPLPAQYWFDKYQHTDTELSKFHYLLYLSSESYQLESAEKLLEWFEDSIPFVEKAYIMNIALSGEYDRAIQQLEKLLFKKGDIDAIFYLGKIYTFFKPDPVRMKSLLEVYSSYRPDLARFLLEHFEAQGFIDNSNPEYLQKVAEYKSYIEAKLPEHTTKTHFFLSWNDMVKAYVIKRLDQKIQQSSIK